MFVRITRPWRNHALGRILDVNDGVADVLVNRRRVAELYDDNGPIDDSHEPGDSRSNKPKPAKAKPRK